MQPSDCFSASYAEARHRFRDAAAAARVAVQSTVLEHRRGADGEVLAMDMAWLGARDARKRLLITSGTQGVEGFAGSAVQVAVLRDAALQAGLASQDVAVMLVHAVNPFGFSHLHRTNESNVDINRNAVRFDVPLPRNDAYEAAHPLLVPDVWPPPERNERDLVALAEALGLPAFIDAIGGGQYQFPDGLFYGGAEPSWSVRALSALLEEHVGAADRIAWIDLHSGPGTFGHGMKVLMNSNDAEAALGRARRWWGNDIALPGDDQTNWARSSGRLSMLCERSGGAELTAIGLDFGTVPPFTSLLAMRADAWRRKHPDAPAARRNAIARQLREAFHSDDPDWQSRVLAQARVAVVQAIAGLGAE